MLEEFPVLARFWMMNGDSPAGPGASSYFVVPSVRRGHGGECFTGDVFPGKGV